MTTGFAHELSVDIVANVQRAHQVIAQYDAAALPHSLRDRAITNRAILFIPRPHKAQAGQQPVTIREQAIPALVGWKKKNGPPEGRPFSKFKAYDASAAIPDARQPSGDAGDQEDHAQAKDLDDHELHHAQIDVLQVPLRHHAFQEVGR